jgi:N-acetylmuramoyl-L-alanine amidase
MRTRIGLESYLSAVFVAVCCLTACAMCQARVVVQGDTVLSRETTHRVGMAGIGSTAGLSLSELCEALGFTWKWDPASEKLSCTKKNRRIEFVQGMPFYLANDTLLQMAAGSPVRRGGLLYLRPELCVEAFAHVMADSLAWRAEDSVFLVTPRAPTATAALFSGGEPVAADSAPVRSPPPEASPKVQKVSRAHAVDTAKRVKAPVEGIKTVVIDPGHGGMDPGAIGPGGIQEKDIVLDIALLLRDEIKKDSKLTVYMTREKDIFIPLQDRTKFANSKKADLFVSIHANSIEGNAKKKENTKGFKIYFLSQAKNEDDKLVAMRENAVIKLEDKTSRYDNLQDILIDMAGNEYLKESQDFSIMISETFHSYLRQIPRLQLGVGQANFWVLNGAYMPSVLIEVGFISNLKEEESLKDPLVKKSIATGIHDAIKSFRKKYEADL